MGLRQKVEKFWLEGVHPRSRPISVVRILVRGSAPQSQLANAALPLPPPSGRREAPLSGRRRRPERSLYSQGRVSFWVDFTLFTLITLFTLFTLITLITLFTLFTLFTLSGAEGAGKILRFGDPLEADSLRNPYETEVGMCTEHCRVGVGLVSRILVRGCAPCGSRS